MAYLIDPTCEDIAIADLRRSLFARREQFHADVGRHLARQSPDRSGDWASEFKRDKVELAGGGTHDFSEIVNQLANVGRLIEALDWFESSPVADHQVALCNPTQSNAVRMIGDRRFRSDLVLHRREASVVCEIWDSCGERRIGNDKLGKALFQLGLEVEREGRKIKSCRFPAASGATSYLLICNSAEEGSRLARSKPGWIPGVGFIELARLGLTRIVEVEASG